MNMNWYLGTVSIMDDDTQTEVSEYTILCARTFVEAMKKMVAYYGNDTADIRLEEVAGDYSALPISDTLYAEIKEYCEQHIVY